MILNDYEKQVYTATLGKVIGVYMGRPFEGWCKEDLAKRWGVVDRYVHEEQKVPLVVPDDDISGTLTFIRALEDSGLYERTPDDFFGKTWENYLLENMTILWWGGMGRSTEHTAFIRLKQGVPSPRSGSMALNGKVVAEQIGAQIFIDAFGMVAPGKPELAATLAEKAARVSHDGEAVYAAQVVAAMVSAAFVEKDIAKVLDAGVSVIPKLSRIAKIHRDVRGWAAKDKDWNATYERIKERYGYARYTGGCHVVPNHAVMVMAWAYGQGDFHKTMTIVCSAGWDTDCNAANVGTVAALVAGLERMDERYDFTSPFADRAIVPTADPTDCVSDVLMHALRIAAIGRTLMKWPSVEAPKGGARHHFSQPGARHGFMSEDSDFVTRGNARITNAPFLGARALSVKFEVGAGKVARVSTPVCPLAASGGYGIVGTAWLYNGMTVQMKGGWDKRNSMMPTVRMFVRTVTVDGKATQGRVYSKPLEVTPEGEFTWTWTISRCADMTIVDFGIEVTAQERMGGEFWIDSIDYGGDAALALIAFPPAAVSTQQLPGWMSNAERQGAFGPYGGITMNEGPGILLTGNRQWGDVELTAKNWLVHSADFAGFLLRYQGMERYYAVGFTRTSAQIVKRYYGREILKEVPFVVEPDMVYPIVTASVTGQTITLRLNEKEIIEAHDAQLSRGAAGFLVETGGFNVQGVRIKAGIME